MQPETQLSGVLMELLLWRPWHFCFDAFPLCASPNLLKHFGTIDSMAIGAVALSNRTPLYDSCFTPEDVLFFDWNFNGIPDKIKVLIEDDPAMQQRAAAGRRAFLAGHTWRHRAEAVLQQVEQVWGI